MYILSMCSILYLQRKDGQTYRSNLELCHSYIHSYPHVYRTTINGGHKEAKCSYRRHNFFSNCVTKN